MQPARLGSQVGCFNLAELFGTVGTALQNATQQHVGFLLKKLTHYSILNINTLPFRSV